jgi:thioredoxin 1
MRKPIIKPIILHAENMRRPIILLILLAAVVLAAGCAGKSLTSENSINSHESTGAAANSPEGKVGAINSPEGATATTKETESNSVNSPGNQGTGTVVEVTQLEQINTALQKGPVFLKIGAEWCEPCQEMKPVLKDLATEYTGKATIMSIDVDQSPKLIDYFGVGSVPDSSVIVGIENNEYIYMQEDGKVNKDRFQARILGLRDKQELEKVLDLALKENAKST